MSKRETGAERRARLEEIQKAQRAEQRKRTLLTAGIGLVAGIVIIGGTGLYIWNQEQDKPRNQPITSFGVAASEAGCTDVETSKSAPSGEHTTDAVEYDTAPPMGGKHNPNWVGYPGPATRHFFTPNDAPGIENLVHNLEHGYNIVWYLPTLPQEDVDTLERLAEKISDDTDTQKFIVTPWDTSRGEFPENMTIGISHWGVSNGYLQHCEKVSGEAIESFVNDHPSSDSPEPNAF